MDYPIYVVGKTENSWKSKNEWLFKISPSQDVLELAPFAIIPANQNSILANQNEFKYRL